MSEKRKTIPFGAVFVLCVLGIGSAALNLPSAISFVLGAFVVVEPSYIYLAQQCLTPIAGIAAFLLVIFKKPKGAAILPAVLAVFSAIDVFNQILLANGELPEWAVTPFISLTLQNVIALLAAVALLLSVLRIKPKFTLIAAIVLYVLWIGWYLKGAVMGGGSYLIEALKDIVLTPVYWLAAVQAVMLRKETN